MRAYSRLSKATSRLQLYHQIPPLGRIWLRAAVGLPVPTRTGLASAGARNVVTVLTWGNTQQGTWAWWDECVDEAYAILPQDATKPGFLPARLQRSATAGRS